MATKPKKTEAEQVPVIDNAKYQSTGETKVWLGITLHRIRTKIAIGFVAAGAVGGWVESEKNLDVHGNAWVSGNAVVSGDALVSSNALVYGNAWIYDNVLVSGNALVCGDAQVYGDAQVSGDARVSGNAQVSDNARVHGDARVSGVVLLATRSDRYNFVAVPTPDGPRIIAGCRYFTFEQARSHWTKTRGGTQLGDESLALVDFLERMCVIRGFMEPVEAHAEAADLTGKAPGAHHG